MEFFDALTLLFAGAAFGIPAGHWIARQERTLDYEREKLAGINLVWPYFVKAIVHATVAERRQPARDTADGGDASR